MSDAKRYALLVFVGMVIVQASWILAVPPFRGVDEFDHVYRAAGVARGQWILTEQVPDARGLAVSVPESLVSAAEEQCEALPYTGAGNCHPVGRAPDGDVVIATAAGHYSPLYYAVTGYAGKPFDGAGAGYAMRAASALLCAVVLAMAAACIGLMRAGPWTRLGFLVGLTPVLMYSTALPAPNAIEIVFAFLLWCACLAVISGRLDRVVEGRLILLGGVAAAATALSRQLGPFWVLVILGLLLLLAGGNRTVELVRTHPWRVAIAGATVLVGAVASAGWSLWTGFFAESTDVGSTSRSATSTLDVTALVPWTLQLIGAFPFPDIPAPIAVYVLYLLVLLPLLALALKRGTRRERVPLVLAIVSTQVIPLALTWVSLSSHGVVWQGRYQLPVVVGIMLMAGLVLDRRATSRRGVDLIQMCVAMLVVAHAWSVAAVRLREARRGDVSLDPAWITLPWPAVAVLAALGVALIAASSVFMARRQVAGEQVTESPQAVRTRPT